MQPRIAGQLRHMIWLRRPREMDLAQRLHHLIHTHIPASGKIYV